MIEPPLAPGSGRGNTTFIKAATACVEQLWREFEAWAGDMPPPDSPGYAERRRAFVIGAGMMRRRAMVLVLQDIATRRPLDAVESALLDRILARERHKRLRWRWTPEEDAKLLKLIEKRAANGRPKPYTKSPEVKRLAKRLGRSYMAVHRRMARLRNCSNAGSNGAG